VILITVITDFQNNMNIYPKYYLSNGLSTLMSIKSVYYVRNGHWALYYILRY